MADELDLERGDPGRADSASERRRARRTARQADTESAGGGKAEAEIRMQLEGAFERLAKMRDTKEDAELADAIREESDPMTEGIVTLTNSVTPLRFPIIILLNLLITMMAFGRVGGILYQRFQDRRVARAQYVEEPSPFDDGELVE